MELRPGRTRSTGLCRSRASGGRGGGLVGWLGLVGDVQLLDLSVEARSGDGEQVGCFRLVLAGALEGLLDQATFELFEEVVQGVAGAGVCGKV